MLTECIGIGHPMLNQSSKLAAIDVDILASRYRDPGLQPMVVVV